MPGAHHLHPGLEAGDHLDHVGESRAERHRHPRHGAIRFHRVHQGLIAFDEHCFGGHGERLGALRQHRGDIGRHAGTELGARVGDAGDDTDAPHARIEGGVDHVDATLEHVARIGGGADMDGDSPLQHRDQAFRGPESDLDLVEAREIGDRLAGAEESAGAHAPRSDEAGEGGDDARLLQPRLRQRQVSLRHLESRRSIIQILRRAGALPHHFLDAVVGDARLVAQRLGTGHLGFQRRVVELHQEIASGDGATLLERQFLHDGVDLGHHLDGIDGLDAAHGLEAIGDRALHHRGGLDGHRRGREVALLLLRTADDENDETSQEPTLHSTQGLQPFEARRRGRISPHGDDRVPPHGGGNVPAVNRRSSAAAFAARTRASE